MRLLPILTALLVTAAFYLLIFERDAVLAFAQVPPAAEEEGATDAARANAVSVVALRSAAQTIDSAVLVRGRTEAARQVIVRAETTGSIISEPLRKGAVVEAGTLLCQLDPGTREILLDEAQARVVEAQARIPEAEARLVEARARVAEAEINDNAARRLSEGGFASDTRVATTMAAMESAKAGVSAAQSGLEAARSGVQSAEASVAAAQREIERLSVRSPFAGLLETDTAELGALLQPGGECATVIQLDPIKLVGFVPETEVERVRVGARAGARLASGRTVSGEVTFLSRSADPNTRTFRVEVEVPNDDQAIRDGQTVEIGIQADGAAAHLLPQSALTLNDDGALGVRIVDPTDAALFVPVDVLSDTTEGVWVAGPPQEARVIVVGQEFVTDGVPVRVSYRETTQ